MPVCKKCRNYVMNFPCPHCGGNFALTDRENDEIKPIIPLDLQGSFKEPPPPISTSEKYNLQVEQKLATTQTEPPPILKQASASSIPAPPPLKAPKQTISYSETSPLPPPDYSPIKGPPKTMPSTINKESSMSPPIPPSQTEFKSPATYEKTSQSSDVIKRFDSIESQLKDIITQQKHYESQIKEFEKKFKEVNNNLKKVEKGLKVLLKSNEKLESIHKKTSKSLKKVS